MFRLGDIVIDRIQYGLAEDFDGNLLYILTQLADATIEISAETKDATDAQGNLVKRFFNAKTGTFTANNAFINTSILTAKSGIPAEIATADNAIAMPKIVSANAGETIVIEGIVDGSVKVNAFYANGNMGVSAEEVFAQGTAASATEFGYTFDDGTGTATIVLPTVEELGETAEFKQFVIKYDRMVTEGIRILNSADKFPGTVKLTLKALCVDPCTADTLRACYIVLPSFQVSPDLSISLTTDGQLEYSGDLQVDYCSAEKALFEFYMASEDEEE